MPNDPVPPPRYRFRRISLGADLDIPLYNPAAMTTRLGVTAVFRPHQYLGLGVTFDTEFSKEVNLLGRVQTSVALDRMGLYHLTLAGLAGIRYLIGEHRQAEDSSATPLMSGTLFSYGLETSFDIQIIRELSISPYVRALLSPPTTLPEVGTSRNFNLAGAGEFLLGLRLNVDFLPTGP